MRNHQQVIIHHQERGWKAEVDAGMQHWVMLLWNHGIATRFSCQNLNSRYGKQIVLDSGESIEQALKLLPWATRASMNRLGYVSLTEKDTRQDDYYWHTIWEAEQL